MTAGCCTPWRQGMAKLDAYLDDYASLANALVSLYEANFDERWIDEAVRLMDIVLDKFADPAGGGSSTRPTTTSSSSRAPRNSPTAARPAATRWPPRRCCGLASCSAAATISTRPSERSRPPCRSCSERRWPPARCCSRSIATWARRTSWCWSATWRATIRKQAIAAMHRRYLPRRLSPPAIRRRPMPTASRSRHLDELFAGKESPDGQPVLYVCQNFACQAPAVGLDAIESQLDQFAARVTDSRRFG